MVTFATEYRTFRLAYTVLFWYYKGMKIKVNGMIYEISSIQVCGVSALVQYVDPLYGLFFVAIPTEELRGRLIWVDA